MDKGWLIWTVVIPFVATGSIFAGVMIGSKYEQPEAPGDQMAVVSAEIEPPPQADPSQLIVGKWRRWGDSQFGEQSKFGATVEYFEDGTYVDHSEGHPPILDPTTINGEYIVLSDGRLKTTRESCLSTPCKTIVSAQPISFPDPNTLWRHYEIGGKPGYNIYHRSPVNPK